MQGEEEFNLPQPPRGRVQHRHMRTIREVRTVVTRIITDVYYIDGAEVERKVIEVNPVSGLNVVVCLLEDRLNPNEQGLDCWDLCGPRKQQS